MSPGRAGDRPPSAEPGPARGIIDRGATPSGTLAHARFAPSAALASLLTHFWSVRWELRAPWTAETLPHPAIHLVFEASRARIVGVMRARFTRVLEGRGWVFGIKLRAGGLARIAKIVAGDLADAEHPIDLLGSAWTAVAERIAASEDEGARIAIAEEALAASIRSPDPLAAEAAEIVDTILSDHTIARVADLVARTGRGPRDLQRLFHRYVGASPKWVIQRERLHEALARIEAGPVDWTGLALDLGYFDHAHFIHDFRALIGVSPAAYARARGPAGIKRSGRARRPAR